MPDDALSFIPFLAIKIGDSFLIQKTCITQTHSVEALDLAQRKWRAALGETRVGSDILDV